jgi:integrase
MDHPAGMSDSFLITASIAPSTARKYTKALRAFVQWADDFYDEFPNSLAELGAALVDYYHHAYRRNRGRGTRQTCINTRAALLLFLPEAAPHFRLSLKCDVGWDRVNPGSQIAPMPFGIALVAVETLLRWDRQSLALAVLLGFYGLLRVGELIDISLSDISPPAGPNRPGGIRLPKTKTGRNQSIVLRQEFLWVIIRRQSQRARAAGRSRLFEFSRKVFAAELRKVLMDLGVNGDQYPPHSLRHGGATWMAVSGCSMKDIAQHGRWASLTNVTRYIQAGKAMLLSQRIPSRLRRKADSLVSKPDRLLKYLN